MPELPAEPPAAWHLAGPTAVGKSAIALELAARLGGEIISVDSMQVYRGLDIGTAKPTPDERARVPHHLIDVAAVQEPFDVARFLELARAAESDLRQRGKVPIYCGGTGFYFKALFTGLDDLPPADRALRHQLEATPPAELLAELERTDPETFARIDRKNPRRIVRALEVIRLTGRPFSARHAARGKERPAPGQFVAFDRESTDLRQRIHDRVDQMFAGGLVAETARLLEQGLEQNPTAMQAIGYRQVVEHLRGLRPLADTIALVKTRTWQFVRRQRTWLRHQLPPAWITLGKAASPAQVVDRLLAGEGGLANGKKLL